MNRREYLRDLESKFIALPAKKPTAFSSGCEEVECRGGVYGIWEKGKLRYFGETCHLRDRLAEMMGCGRHHALNVLLGQNAHGMKGRDKSAWFADSPYTVAWMVVDVGRAELEEYMVLKYATDLKNHPGVRFSRRQDMPEWREMIS